MGIMNLKLPTIRLINQIRKTTISIVHILFLATPLLVFYKMAKFLILKKNNQRSLVN